MRTPHFLTTLLVFSSLASSSYAGPDCQTCGPSFHAPASTGSPARITARPEASPAFGGKVRTSDVNVEGGEKRQVKSVGNTILPSSYDSNDDGAKAQMWAEEKNDTLAQGEFKTPSGFHGDLYRSDDGSWKIKDPEGGTLRSLGVDKQGNLYVLRHEGKERKFEQLKPEEATAIKKQITAALEKAQEGSPERKALNSLSKSAKLEEPASNDVPITLRSHDGGSLQVGTVDSGKLNAWNAYVKQFLSEKGYKEDPGKAWYTRNQDWHELYFSARDQGFSPEIAAFLTTEQLRPRSQDRTVYNLAPQEVRRLGSSGTTTREAWFDRQGELGLPRNQTIEQAYQERRKK
ncbi:MAG: hypothetical protein EBQ85_07740 [Proteobacteria bacterium]|nr:hypothetical protein [Pseudomonadota bacterium]